MNTIHFLDGFNATYVEQFVSMNERKDVVGGVTVALLDGPREEHEVALDNLAAAGESVRKIPEVRKVLETFAELKTERNKRLVFGGLHLEEPTSLVQAYHFIINRERYRDVEEMHWYRASRDSYVIQKRRPQL